MNDHNDFQIGIDSQIAERRKLICGPLWPPDDMSGMNTMQVFQAMQTCGSNRELEYRNALLAKDEKSNHSMDNWAAWRNAERLYKDEMLKRLQSL